jgi:hypothetical protein
MKIPNKIKLVKFVSGAQLNKYVKLMHNPGKNQGFPVHMHVLLSFHSAQVVSHLSMLVVNFLTVMSISLEQLQVTFSLRRKKVPRKLKIFYVTFNCNLFFAKKNTTQRKPKMFSVMFNCYNLNQVLTQPEFKHLCCEARAWPMGQAEVCVDL